MKQRFTITGIDCPNCAAKLAKNIESREGVASCKINFLSEKLTVESELSYDALISLIEKECRAFSPDVKLEK